jgi:hypothetical protein
LEKILQRKSARASIGVQVVNGQITGILICASVTQLHGLVAPTDVYAVSLWK